MLDFENYQLEEFGDHASGGVSHCDQTGEVNQ
jgi:hypothetical protein